MRLSKAVSSAISFVMIISISVVAVSIVYLFVKPIVDRSLESTIVNEAFVNMDILSTVIGGLASEGVGSLRTITLQVNGGSYRVDDAANSLYFDYNIKSKLLDPGTVTKRGDVQVITGGAGAFATENSTHFILENEILKVVLNKTGNTTLSNVVDGLENGLASWWRFDETSGNTTSDSKSNNTAKINDTVSPVSGKFGMAKYIPNSSYFIKVDSLNFSSNSGKWTLTGWFKLDSTANTGGQTHTQFTDIEGYDEVNGYFWIYNDWDSPIGIRLRWSNGALQFTDWSLPSIDTNWHHYAYIIDWDGDTAKLFFDGQPQAVRTMTNSIKPPINGRAFYIGRSVNIHPYNGSVDDVRLYDRLLSENEIRALYQSFWTKYNIRSIENKLVGQTIHPKDSSVVLGNDSSSSYGVGYSKLILSGTGLSQAEATYHVNSGNYKYNILYSLPSLADYLVVQIQNTTNTNNTFTLRYNISDNGLNDIFSIGNKIYNISNITQSCWNSANITDYFSCSNYNSFGGLVYSGSSNQFINTCFSNSTTDYTFNLTSNSLQKIIIPLASGNCSKLSEVIYQIKDYGQPSASFSTYIGVTSETVNLQLKLNYPKIILTGDGNTIGKGSNRLCIEKTGVSNNLPVVNIRRC